MAKYLHILFSACLLFLIGEKGYSQCTGTCYASPYPAGTFLPSSCIGTVQNITTSGYAGEYSHVWVTQGLSYTFSSSNAADYITITTTTPASLTWGTTPVVWVATFTGTVRFYTHTSAACGCQAANRTRRVAQSGSPANNNFANAITLTVGAAAIYGGTNCASLQANESPGCNKYGANTPINESVWYKFTATATTSYVIADLYNGCYNTWGVSIWKNIASYPLLGSQYEYCGMETCQGMDYNSDFFCGTDDPLKFQLCTTVGTTYYIQVVSNSSACGPGPAIFLINVQNGNPGGTITNPCPAPNQAANSVTSPLAICYIDDCITDPAATCTTPGCTAYPLTSGNCNQQNMVYNAFYSFSTSTGCSNDLMFQNCLTSTCGAGNVDWMCWQLYDASGTTCLYSGDLSSVGITAPLTGAGCNTGYVLQYTFELLTCSYTQQVPFTDNYQSTACSPQALPVQILSFDAACIENKVIVNWETATEDNSDYFTLEKSADGTTFYSIAKVKAAGNSSTVKKYSAQDKEPFSVSAYYRLMATDFDGTTKTFSPISASCDKENLFSMDVNGNPVTDGTINLSINASEEGENILLVLTDVLGRELYTKTIVTPSGNFLLTLSPEQQLSRGMYIITASGNDAFISRKIIVK